MSVIDNQSYPQIVNVTSSTSSVLKETIFLPPLEEENTSINNDSSVNSNSSSISLEENKREDISTTTNLSSECSGYIQRFK